jgi:hypothetical protein
MQDLQAGEVSDLHAAAFTVGQNDLRSEAVDRFSEVFSNLLRDFILLFIEPEGPAHTAAISLNIVDLKTWNESKNLEGGESNVERPQMARGKIGDPQGELLEIDIEIFRSI